MSHRWYTEEEKRERAVKVENLKAHYANPEKLREGIDAMADKMAGMIIDGTFKVKRRQGDAVGKGK
jgi:hypothetical protein